MKNVLVIVDMQNDFISGSLANKDGEKVVKNIIKETIDKILNSKFDINPKFDKKNIGCEMCDYKDICFMNNGNLEKTLINLGFNKKGIIDKQRSKYLYDNKYEISLDNVKDIGLFIEIEVKRIDKDKIIEYANLLQLLRYLNIDINLIDDKRYYEI